MGACYAAQLPHEDPAAPGNAFGLQVDEEATRLWRSFAASPPPKCTSETEARLQRAARQAALRVWFLRLEVFGRQELQQLTRNALQHYSPLKFVPQQDKAELINAAAASAPSARALGAVVGFVVADALGAPFEFLPASDSVCFNGSYFEPETLTNVRPKNKFRVKPGQWTDDSAMGLCLGDSLLARGQYEGSDVRVRFWNWWFRGYCNAFGNDPSRHSSIGLGDNVKKSLEDMAPNEVPAPRYEANTEDSGNGTLMRLAPVPVFYSRKASVAAKYASESSLATHPGKIAAAACAFLGFAIARAIERPGDDASSAAEFLDRVVHDFLSTQAHRSCREIDRLLRSKEPPGREQCWNWRADQLAVEASLTARGRSYNGYPCSWNYFGSYAVDGLAVALWSFYHEASFLGAVARCVNFLGDADSTAAICGQLAGAFYGYNAIDRRLLKRLEAWDNRDVATRGALLYAMRWDQAAAA